MNTTQPGELSSCEVAQCANALKAQLEAQHREDISAIDRLILLAPVARAKARPARPATAQPTISGSGGQRFGWMAAAIREFVANAAEAFTTEQVKAHVRTVNPDVPDKTLYQVASNLLMLRERGLIDRTGTGQASRWHRTGAALKGAAVDGAAGRYKSFRDSLKIQNGEAA